VQGREVKVGGYGFPISDEGSGADLGLRAIRLALRASDGRIAATRLTRDVMARFNDDPFAAVAWMDRATATDYATLAPLVMRHADAGDAVGRRIARAAAIQIDAIARRLVECGAPRIALAGGLASRMEPWLAPDVRRRLSPVEGDAVAGALLLARRQRPAVVRRTG
jgi:glucosamine kinase